jgi:hypothetical protein
MQHARAILNARLSALQKDVDHCLVRPYAPLPALLYCFSTIDLLGALYKGNAKSKSDTTGMARKYMKRFMGYSAEQVTLIQGLFRHKIVHLAVPRPVLENKSRAIGWRYYHKHEGLHLTLKRFKKPRYLRVSDSKKIEYNYWFTVGIKNLAIDIEDSVKRYKTGYLAMLSTTKSLQSNFERAYQQIYDSRK